MRIVKLQELGNISKLGNCFLKFPFYEGTCNNLDNSLLEQEENILAMTSNTNKTLKHIHVHTEVLNGARPIHPL